MYINMYSVVPSHSLRCLYMSFFQWGDENQHKTTRMCFCSSREPVSIDISLTTAIQQNNALSSTKHIFCIYCIYCILYTIYHIPYTIYYILYTLI